jgi:hypothetical protein
MLSRNDRIIVEAIKKAQVVEIRLLDRGAEHTVRITRDSRCCHDIALAVQDYLKRSAK